MKNKNSIFAGLVLAIFLISFSSACNVYHPKTYNDISGDDLNTNDGVIFVAYDNQYHGPEIYEKENNNRYAVSDYAYGYTYRASKKYYSYKENALRQQVYSEPKSYRNKLTGPNWLFDGNKNRVNFQDKPDYYYLYNDYTQSYEKHTCYVNPPSDKLIYVKCP